MNFVGIVQQLMANNGTRQCSLGPRPNPNPAHIARVICAGVGLGQGPRHQEVYLASKTRGATVEPTKH